MFLLDNSAALQNLRIHRAGITGFMLFCLLSQKEGACYELCVKKKKNINIVYTLAFRTWTASLSVWTTISSSKLWQKNKFLGSMNQD